jgi:hypothetical protein
LFACANDLLNRARACGATGFCNIAHLFTPLFTPAHFCRSNRTQNFQQVIAAQAQLQFSAKVCPLYPRKQTSAVHAAMSALGK